MNSKQNQKSENWAEIQNFYQDERREHANGVALRWVTWTATAEALLIGLYLLIAQSNLLVGLPFLAAGAALAGWFGWQHCTLGNDEFAEYQLGQQYLKVGPYLLAASLFIFAIAGFMGAPNLVMIVLVALPGVVGIYMQLAQKIVPWHLALLVFVILGLTTVAGYLIATGIF